MSLNLNVNYGGNWNAGADGTTGPNATQNTQAASFKDNVVTLGGLQISFNYNQDIGAPALPKPNEFASTKLPQQETGSGDESNLSFENAYYDSFSQELQKLIDAPPHLTEEQAQKLVFAKMTGEQIPDDTFLNDQLAGLEDKVGQEMLEAFGEDFPSIANQAKALKGKGDSLVGSSKEQLQELQKYADSLPAGAEKEKLQQLIKQAQSNLSDIEQSLSQLQNASDRQQFSERLNQLKSQIKQFNAGLKGGGFTDPNVGSALAKIAAGIGKGVESFSDNIIAADQNNQLAQGNWKGALNETSEVFKKTFGASFEQSFEDALSKYAAEHSLSEEDVAKLRFAHNNPDAEGLDPNTKAMLNEVNSQAVEQMSDAWGIPPGYVPKVDNGKFNAEVEVAFEDAFKQVLEAGDFQDLAQAVGMSEEDIYGALEFLNDNPDLVEQMKGDNSLLGKMLGLDSQEKFKKILQKLSQLQGQAMSQISSQYGVPSNFKMGKGDYSIMLQGRFLQMFEQNLKNQDPPLTKEQIADVRAALSDPLNPNITKQTKALIQKIYSQSLGQMRELYNVPVGWTAPVAALSSINTPAANIKMASAGIEQVEEGLTLLAKQVNGMADGPEKSIFINVLKMVADAIAHLKERIAYLQIMDGDVSKKLSIAQRDQGLYKTELQMDKIKEAAEKKAKMATMKWLGPLIKVIMLIIMVVLLLVLAGPVMGPLLAAVFTAATIQDIATGGKQNFITDSFKAIMKNLPEPLNMIVAILIIIVIAMMAGGLAGIMVFLDLFFSHSQVIQNFVKMCGGDKMAQEITNMVCQIVTEIVVMIVLMVLTGGAAGAVMMGQIAAKISTTMARTLELVASFLDKFGKVGKMLAESLMTIVKELDEFARATTVATKALEAANKEVAALEKSYKTAFKLAKSTGDVEHINAAAKMLDQLKYAKGIQEGLKSALLTSSGMTLLTTVVNNVMLGTSLLNGANQLNQARISFIRAQLDIALGELDAEIAQLEALLKMLRKLLDMLLSGIQSLGDWMKELGDIQNKMYKDLSETTTMIAGASK